MTTNMEISPQCKKKVTPLKQSAAYLFGVIILTCFASYSSVAQAHPEECVDETAQAVFLPAAGIICLQQIKITDSSGTEYYKASLKWLGPEKPNKFELASVDVDSNSEENTPTFSIGTGILALPKIDVPEAYGTNRYSVELALKQENGMTIFELTSAETYISPDYIQGETWKPYALLSATERQAVNLLGQSLPYAQMANSIYSFDNTSINDWELVEQISKDSGMQAGVYINQETEELVIAFRGTEACDFPCSLAETKESILDLAADTLLSFGESGPQFRHAFNFAEEIIDRYPDYKIKVTGHSLGGGLAQAIGTSFNLETFAFNSAPVPNDFFAEHPTDLTDEELNKIIHVIADIYDPVSHSDDSGETYLNAAHVSPLIQLDFDKKEVLPNLDLGRLEELYTLRFDKHSMSGLIDSTSELLNIYAQGW